MDDLTPRPRVHLKAIEAAYPGRRILGRRNWRWATKCAPPTEAQKGAVVLYQFTRLGPFELVAAPNVQHGILARLGAARWP
ncbi:hypothetical protein [Spongiactinospora sp. 9N601]|uniref:hypothetical protein n=1 Tax=Spongiactinospora sp. 9N601 TaxID=3375149 RepID=UPI003797E8E4